jgi:hypothetical protein
MIIINATSTGLVLSAGRGVAGVEYEGDIPNDFYSTFSIGKYLFINNQIVPVSNWVYPAQAKLTAAGIV